MKRFLIRRAFTALLTILVVTPVVFVLARLQGDPRTLYVEEDLPQELYDAMGKRFGLDKPVFVQFVIFLGQLARGDLGKSIHQRRPVATIIVEKIPASASATTAARTLCSILGLMRLPTHAPA